MLSVGRLAGHVLTVLQTWTCGRGRRQGPKETYGSVCGRPRYVEAKYRRELFV